MEGLLALVKRILMQAVVAVIVSGVVVYLHGKFYLALPIVAGCIVGLACWLVASYRILKSAQFSIEEAKKNMQFGWGIRLLLILVTFIAAARISEEVFWAVVAGFFLMFVLVMANVIVYAYGLNANKKK